MKLLLITVAALSFLQVDGGVASISPGMPAFMVETVAQAIMCKKQLSFVPKGKEHLDIGNILVEDNPSFNEYFGCIWQKKGIINAQGNISEVALRQYFVDLFTMGAPITEEQKRLVEVVVQKCKNEQGTDYGDKSVKVHNCALKHLYKSADAAENASRAN